MCIKIFFFWHYNWKKIHCREYLHAIFVFTFLVMDWGCLKNTIFRKNLIAHYNRGKDFKYIISSHVLIAKVVLNISLDFKIFILKKFQYYLFPNSPLKKILFFYWWEVEYLNNHLVMVKIAPPELKWYDYSSTHQLSVFWFRVCIDFVNLML